MRIIINDHLGLAPQVQLSRALASRGHDVLHLYSADAQTPKADLTRRIDDPPTLSIEGLELGSGPTKSFLASRWQERRFGRSVAKRAMAFRPDVVVGCHNPLGVQRAIQSACIGAAIPFVYWMQDFYASKIDRLLEGRSSIMNIAVGSYYHALERELLHRSDAIVPIADDYLGILAQTLDIDDRKCMVVHNWFPLDRVTPGEKSNNWSRSNGLADKKVALYSGTLGVDENPELLLELAEHLQNTSDIEIVIVSEGVEADRIAAQARDRSIRNLRVLPFQPYEMFGDILASADVLLAMVEARAGIVYVPSKVASYFCAGRAIVLSAPWQNVAASLVRQSNAGTVVPPGDAKAMSDAVLQYFNDVKLREETGARAREYAEHTFAISSIADRFERLFVRLTTGPRRAVI